MDVKDGLINKLKITGDFFSNKDINDIEELLIGKLHNKEAIETALKQIDFKEYFRNITIDEFITGLF